MNLNDDAMLVSLRITAWSGRLYDRAASNHVAVHHDAASRTTFVVRTRRRQFRDSSLTRTHARSREELESPRARVS